jgi:IclR family acetate operon transcriptional repressor
MASRIGMQIPLHRTSIGKAVLATLPPDKNEAGVRCAGAAVYPASGSVLGGISVSGLTFTLTIDELHGIGPAVATAAQRLSGALGYHLAALR